MNKPANSRRVLLTIAVLALAMVTVALALSVVRPIVLTEAHGSEMRLAVQRFRQAKDAVQTRLRPELLLSVVTPEYYTVYLEMNQDTVFCQGCDRFWVTTAVEVREMRVLDYSATRAVVRARVWTQGHMVWRDTLRRFDWIEHPASDQATYEFVRTSESEPWKLRATHDFVPGEQSGTP